jgi:hypothetical protein
LQLWATADDARVQCDSLPINFAPTFMHQSRTFAFPVKNTGITAVMCSWRVETLDGCLDKSGMYKVSRNTSVNGFGARIHVEYKIERGMMRWTHTDRERERGRGETEDPG